MIIRKAVLFDLGWNTSFDGPGQRCVLYFKGCNFTCPWCGNPEGMESGKGKNGREYTVPELLAYAKKYKHFFGKFGGVTVTGGEPTCQFELLLKLLKGLKKEGINTALETNGFSPRLPELFKHLDLLICDLKVFDGSNHIKSIGVSNKEVLVNIKKAVKAKIPLWVRIPVIPGYTDSKENIKSIAGFLAPMRKHIKVELLPYHAMGESKWKALSKEYLLKGTRPVSKAKMGGLYRLLSAKKLDVIKL